MLPIKYNSSSQNSANHTFLRLLARVRLLKYRSNPILKKKGMEKKEKTHNSFHVNHVVPRPSHTIPT